MNKHRIILDCDPGRDDALAIALTLAAPEEIDLLGITTVAGNIPLELTQRNARIICELAGREDIAVYAGEDRPLIAKLVTAEGVHGDSGLEGIDIFEPTRPLETQHAVEFIIETLRTTPMDNITLVVTGPLTNIAKAFQQAPDIIKSIKQIVIMGGARSECGNVTPSAEFNFYVDPHAAHIVLQSGCPIVVISLDVTSFVREDASVVNRLRAIKTPIASALADLYATERYIDSGKFNDMVATHDPCTIAWILWPELFESCYVNVEVDTREGITFGASVVDIRNKTERNPNVRWATKLDDQEFFDRFIERIARLS